MNAFVFVYTVCDESVAAYAMARPCKAYKRVYMKSKLDSYDYNYVYEILFKEYDITFPLSDFETGMLTMMNIVPSQLHPKTWAFLKCFELLCRHLGFELSINIFTHFYQIKFGKLIGWVSLSATYDDSLFILYSSSYKHFKKKKIKLCCHAEDLERSYSSSSTSLLGSRCIGRDLRGLNGRPSTKLLPRRGRL